jgi:hypothetical protein
MFGGRKQKEPKVIKRGVVCLFVCLFISTAIGSVWCQFVLAYWMICFLFPVLPLPCFSCCFRHVGFRDVWTCARSWPSVHWHASRFSFVLSCNHGFLTAVFIEVCFFSTLRESSAVQNVSYLFCWDRIGIRE